jgi:8-oxo-dGTP pyrophosphatase MutT (NUDIX family)
MEVLLVKRNDTVAFMAGAYVFPGGRVDDADRFGAADEEAAYRNAGARELLEEANVRIDANALHLIAHWVTPEIEIRRYDTRFFLARMPEGQEARHDAGETTAFEWLTPAEAIARSKSGSIQLPPPTWTTLRQLERFQSVDEVFAWARTKAVPCVMPGFHKDETQTFLTLPGDPLHPTIPGWEVPEETRFVLEEGVWKARSIN